MFVLILCSEEEHLHLLVNNAGVNMCPEDRSADKFELQFAVNYLGKTCTFLSILLFFLFLSSLPLLSLPISFFFFLTAILSVDLLFSFYFVILFVHT